MFILFTFTIGQTIFYMKDNKVHSAPVLSRKYVENGSEVACNSSQEGLFERFGQEGTWYSTCHGEFTEEQVAETKELLLGML